MEITQPKIMETKNQYWYNTLSFPRRRESRLVIMKNYYIYILASKRNGTLYVGVTNNLTKRVAEHKNGIVDGFTKKYKVHNLVYYERTNDIESALNREKAIKKWNREWNLDL